MFAILALTLMDDPLRVVSTVQIGITAVGILTGAVGASLEADRRRAPARSSAAS